MGRFFVFFSFKLRFVEFLYSKLLLLLVVVVLLLLLFWLSQEIFLDFA